MKTTAFAALLAFVLVGSVGCASNSAGPYGDPGVGNVALDGRSPAVLHPISGTDEDVELFKDEGSD
jgi:hypothetical protein